ncbi:MAG TPA: hypothetical protein VIL72_01050 [Beijerinckiaceae bacterium]
MSGAEKCYIGAGAHCEDPSMLIHDRLPGRGTPVGGPRGTA